MKKLYTIICSLLLMSCTMFPKDEDKSTEIVGKIIQKTASTLSKKYNMHPAATNISMPAGIVNSLGIDFDIYTGPLPKEKLREILVHAIQDFLAIGKEYPELELYLKERPFGMKHIEIILFVNTPEGFPVRDPYIATARIAKGQIDYRTLKNVYNPSSKRDIPVETKEEKESYEEALIALGEESS